MKIVFLNGGLANQVFQYIFYRFAQIHQPNDGWVLDDSFFFIHDVHNGYELERVFGIKPDLLSHSFDPDVWDYMIQLKRDQGKSIPQILLDNGTPIEMISESNNSAHWNPFNGTFKEIRSASFVPEIIEMEGNVYYHGYWITSEWFHAIERFLIEELTFPPVNEPENISYMREIDASASCSIHIRRGDYVSAGFAVADDIYRSEIEDMLRNVPDIKLFVFSDDIDYCKNHYHEMGFDLPRETVFVEGNTGQRSFRDMQLMSRCKYMINGNSAFCYLAALLNTNLEGIINPSKRKL